MDRGLSSVNAERVALRASLTGEALGSGAPELLFP